MSGCSRKVCIGGSNKTNLRFADDIDALAEEKQELLALVESLKSLHGSLLIRPN